MVSSLSHPLSETTLIILLGKTRTYFQGNGGLCGRHSWFPRRRSISKRCSRRLYWLWTRPSSGDMSEGDEGDPPRAQQRTSMSHCPFFFTMIHFILFLSSPFISRDPLANVVITQPFVVFPWTLTKVGLIFVLLSSLSDPSDHSSLQLGCSGR